MVDSNAKDRSSKARGRTQLPVDEGLSSLRKVLDGIWSRIANIADPQSNRILFVSPEHGTGNTTLATCTALGLARNLRERVALIEANPYTPGMAAYLGISETPGFTDVLDGHVESSEAIRNSLAPGLHVLTAGSFREPEIGELASPEVGTLISAASRGHRFAIVDAPPLPDHPDARALLEHVDSVVVVLRARSTQRAQAQRLVQQIREAGVPILGTVLNRYQSDLPFGFGDRALD